MHNYIKVSATLQDRLSVDRCSAFIFSYKPQQTTHFLKA